jgi:multiple antibiotic resistance protein
MEFNPQEVVLLLFATIGPLKATIVCASLTDGASPEFVRKVALRSVLIASIICIVFAVLGEVILQLFKVSIPAFQIGGGIIVLLFSLDMVVSKEGGENGADGSEKKRSEPSLKIATFPLGIPLLASVSGLVAIVSLLAQGDDLKAVLFLTAVIVAIMTIDYFCLRACHLIVTAVGPVALQVVGKLMGVILTSLAVELILMGLIGLGIVAKPAARTAGEAPSPRTETTSSQGLPNSTWGAVGGRGGTRPGHRPEPPPLLEGGSGEGPRAVLPRTGQPLRPRLAWIPTGGQSP